MPSLSQRRRSLVLGHRRVRAAGRRLRRARRFFALPGARVSQFGGLDDGLVLHGEDRRAGTVRPALAAAQSAVADGAGRRRSLACRTTAPTRSCRASTRQPPALRWPLSASMLRVFQRAQARQPLGLRWRVRRHRRAARSTLGLRAVEPTAVPCCRRARCIGRRRRRVDWRARARPRGARVTEARCRSAGRPVGHRQGLRRRPCRGALERLALSDYMVEVGGEIRARGSNARRPAVAASASSARRDAAARALASCRSTGKAMATSGDYRNFFMHEGTRYSHEIDPASGVPIRHGLCSVTVVADAMHADAPGHRADRAGRGEGTRVGRGAGIAAQFIERRPDGAFHDSMTSAFSALQPVRA